MSCQILKLPEVVIRTGRSKSAIYRDVAKGKFPNPIKLSERSSGWIESEVELWLEDRITASRTGMGG